MDKKIQINQLLLERERCLSEVFDLEQQIAIVFGEPYPLDLPVDLPSLRKRRKVRAKKKKKAAPFRLRKLAPDEFAYRIVYVDQDERHEELHTDGTALALVLNTDLPDTRVESIDIVVRGDDGTLTPVETLFPVPAAD